ncbi:MAG TPA: hypothetical protein VKJ01_17030, partial [Candidatus Solibacter sp.]|nr:hypothetical protein [Candidatus Solibacter sp.]
GQTGSPSPGNIIPANRLSAQAQFFARYIPDPNFGANRAVFAPSQTLNQDQFTVRVDQTITSTNRAFVRWSWINYDELDPNAFPALSERGRVQFRAEAFNLTNSPSFSAPGTNIDTATGGVVTSTLSAPRNVQLALKFSF